MGPVVLTRPVVTTWVIMAGLTGASWLGTRRLSAVPGAWQASLEVVVGALREQLRQIVHRDPAPLLPLVGTLFLYLLVANLCALVPGVDAPTASLETPAALALVVLSSIHVFGVRSRGLVGYLKRYLQPNPLLLPLNVLADFTRPFSMMVRLFGNVMSDELVVGVVVSLAALLVPIPLMLLTLLIGVVQAYIFTVLAAVFLAAAMEAQ